MAYQLSTFDIKALLTPVTQATAHLARLDERLARSPVRDGFIERQHFADAAAALWLEGELVHLEDLVLHDARMDIRTPTHELTRAHVVLRPPPDFVARARMGTLPRRSFFFGAHAERRRLVDRGRAARGGDFGPADRS